MDPDTINCVILRIHVDKIIITIPSHAIQRQTSVSARYGSKKKYQQSHSIHNSSPLQGIATHKLFLRQHSKRLFLLFSFKRKKICCSHFHIFPYFYPRGKQAMIPACYISVPDENSSQPQRSFDAVELTKKAYAVLLVGLRNVYICIKRFNVRAPTNSYLIKRPNFDIFETAMVLNVLQLGLNLSSS